MYKKNSIAYLNYFIQSGVCFLIKLKNEIKTNTKSKQSLNIAIYKMFIIKTLLVKTNKLKRFELLRLFLLFKNHLLNLCK